MIGRVECVLQGVTSESFVHECALHVLFKGIREDGRGDDSCDKVQRRGGKEYAAETNTQVDP